jgi:hypothetical protein
VSLLCDLLRPAVDLDYIAAIPRYRIEELATGRERIKTFQKIRRSPTVTRFLTRRLKLKVNGGQECGGPTS